MAKRSRVNLIFAVAMWVCLAAMSIDRVVSDPAHAWLYVGIVSAANILCMPVFYQYERSSGKARLPNMLGTVFLGLVLIAQFAAPRLPYGWPKELVEFTCRVFLYTMQLWLWIFFPYAIPPAKTPATPAAPAVQR